MMQDVHVGTLLQWCRKRVATTLVLAALSIASLCLATVAAVFVMVDRDASEQRLRQAVDVGLELELLVDLHLAANTDFLKGVGTAAFESHAWPVARAVMAARAYDHLDGLLADSPATAAKLAELRELSGRWPRLLQDAAQSVALASHGAVVDSGRLLRANQCLESIMDLLAMLRSEERDKIESMQETAQQQIVKQRIALIAGVAIGVLLLAFALSSRHRSALARNAARIVEDEAQKRFNQYFEQHPVAMLIYEVATGAILTANSAAQRQYKGTLEQLSAASIVDLRPVDEVATFHRDLDRYLQTGTGSGSAGIRRHRRLDGAVIFVDVSFHLLSFGGHEACFITAHDVSAHERAKEQLHIRSRALDATRDAIIISHVCGDAHCVTYANTAFERLTGQPVASVLGAHTHATLGWNPATPEVESLTRAMRDNYEASQLLQMSGRDGASFWADTYVAPVRDDNGRPTHCITVLSDVSERVRHQDQLRKQALEDPLTGLPNRLALGALLDRAMDVARRSGQTLGLVFVDLDNFKGVNDGFGHAAGDKVLCEISTRLKSDATSSEAVTRYAGDEFVLLLLAEGRDECLLQANKLAASIRQPIKVGEDTVAPSASIGVAFFPDHGKDAESLVRAADSAMYRSKSLRAGSAQVFDPAFAAVATARTAMAKALEEAVSRDELFLLYQPKVCLRTRKVLGFEALLRWQTRSLGVVGPAHFIPLAESTGLIAQIGEWVLEQACIQAAEWAKLSPGVVVAVNVSPVQFERTDVPAIVARTLKRTCVDPRNIELEITESTLMAPAALPSLHALRRLGVSIAIDDFGTGFSSLGYVRSFMADRLKLDMSFVRGIGCSRADEVIVKAVIAMGQALNIRVVAEGVETTDQLDYLVSSDCDEVQGFGFGRPMRPEPAGLLLTQSHEAGFSDPVEYVLM